MVFNGTLPKKKPMVKKIEMVDMDRVYQYLLFSRSFDLETYIDGYVRDRYYKAKKIYI